MNAITKFDLTPRQLTLVKSTIAKDCNDDEFSLFMEAARSYGLDPFRKQIMPLVFSKGNAEKRRMSIIVSQDGLRVIAQRCKNYRPASEPPEIIFDPELKGPLNPKGIVLAHVYLWQQDNRGDWFKVAGEAYWDEFAPVADEWAAGDDGKRRPTGKKTLDASGNWARMPVIMIAKCATSQALRAGWPDQFSGAYAEEEMDRARVMDLSASEIVEHEREENRMKLIAGNDTITVSWGDGWALDNVPIGQFMDRALEFIDQSDAATVTKWASTNNAGLKMFWARQPGDALDLKRRIEQASKPINLVKNGERVAANVRA